MNWPTCCTDLKIKSIVGMRRSGRRIQTPARTQNQLEAVKIMRNYKIYPLHLGTINRDNTNMMYMCEPGKKIDIPLIAWLITDGKSNILVDTGGTAADGIHYMPYMQESGQDIITQLARHEVIPEDIQIVVMTHLHWDHAGNNRLFQNAVFYTQRKELEYAVAPLAIQKNAYNYKLIFQTQYCVLDGATQILEGISVIETPGHSPGSQSVIVETEKGPYIIVGDLIGLYACIEHDPMIVNGLHTNLFEYYDSLNRVIASGCTILPGHDPKVLEHEAYPM
ncbi:N-acyl homoserine lactonase family protein [Marasmitruncus massiliensis]|uniref:N-acyl homoserine lactonase family protein n=1 Tax=Marasmitruncus massiliensis TaxID=1944642 RepID=UPI0015E0762D|nr:N-acyl homoserine lactonase family protein [Marasmitruncus massiliensis]